MNKVSASVGRRWASWLAFSVVLVLAIIGITSILVIRGAKALVVEAAEPGPGERYQQS